MCEVPEPVKEELNQTINSVENGEIQVEDFRKKLAGHLEKETSLPITPNIKYLVESMSVEYDKIFRDGKHSMFDIYSQEMLDNVNYELKTLWINYGKKHDFNPIHSHSGVYSFVIWVKLPYDMEEEQRMYNPNGNKTASFNFVHSSESELISHPVDIKEWNMAFFSAKLNHCVYPFYTSDEYRISISGNIFAVVS